MYAMERQQQIERLLLDEGRVSVIELARRFEVTTETVRRDLDQLERTGALRRVHGGAVTRDRDNPNRYFTIVEFPSYEVAMENSARPETDKFARALAARCTSGPKFYNLDVQESMP